MCPTEIIAFSDRIKDFKSINTEIVGVSTDSHFSHLAWLVFGTYIGIDKSDIQIL